MGCYKTVTSDEINLEFFSHFEQKFYRKAEETGGYRKKTMRIVRERGHIEETYFI